MVKPTRPPANGFVKALRKVYNPIGFSKGYNATLWFIFNGALLGFLLARFMYFNYWGVFCNPNVGGGNGASPGECFQYSRETFRLVGIQMHLYTIMPAAFLAVLQFTPFIRHKAILFHRICGYLALLLSLAGTAGALMMARFAFGGGLEIQALVGLLAIVFLGSLGLAYWNIKRLQIEQHRAWMLRAWFYAGAIITDRIIMIITALIISMPGMGPYFQVIQCDELYSMLKNHTLVQQRYPTCMNGNDYAAVPANFNGSVENVAAVLDITFGMSLWLAFAIHAIGVEIYLHLTPAEFERLRKISYQKQLERGFRTPGSAGITSDKVGDSERWMYAPVDGGNISRGDGSDSREEMHAMVSKVVPSHEGEETAYSH